MKALAALVWLRFVQTILAIDVDWSSTDSIKAGARIAADGMMSYYTGNLTGQTPGTLPQPYYWWEAGAMFGALVDYYHYTGDPAYNSVTMQALQFQVGPHNDYMPPNETASLGNDDQAFWAMAALRAAETNFPDPPAGAPSWLELAQATFNEQVARWDTQFCGGGIRWQIYPQNRGYDLKNSISNGCLFNIASRLARYTGDDHYAAWAGKIWDWMWEIGLIDENYNVYDNSEADRLNCTQFDKHQWVYNAGTMLMGASTMYNYTNGSTLWQNRTNSLLSTLAYDFFPSGIMKDICEEYNQCNPDEHSFKAYLSRWMAASTQMAPFTYNVSYPLLLSSAKAAAAQCTGTVGGGGAGTTNGGGGARQNVCGLKWYLNGTWDGSNGVGQQMAALEVILGTLIKHVAAPVTNSTGGTSVGNPSAGYNASNVPPGQEVPPAQKGDRIGAWFLTGVVCVLALACWGFMGTGVLEGVGGKPTIQGRMARASRVWNEKGMGKGKAREVLDLGENGQVSVEALSKLPLESIDETPGQREIQNLGSPDRRSTPIYRGGDLPT